MAANPEPTYEPYRPPIISHERINPFDKNKTPAYDNKTSGIYSTLSSNVTAVPVASTAPVETKPVEKYSAPIETKPTTAPSFSSTTGFDYSYKPPSIPVYVSEKSVEKEDSKASDFDSKPSDFEVERKGPRHKFERKLSDADIVFGSKPEPYTSSFKVENYSRNRSNSSFTSTSTDSGYVYGNRGALKDNPFQKSLSVSSDKDGDFAHDPSVLASRAYQGINNDAFSDFDSPKPSASATKPWSNNDDDDDFDLK